MKKIFKKIKKTYSDKKGFTLLETLVAVFILTLALTGPIYIATLAIKSSVESRDNISAYFLAEEAVEAVRNYRDAASLKGSADWLEGLRPCHVTSGTTPKNVCNLIRQDYGVYTFEVCPGSGVCPQIRFDANNNTVIYGGNGLTGNPILSKFSREIYLEDKVMDKEVLVYVTIKWKDKGRDRQFQIVETLHNQQYNKYYIE